MLVSGKLVQILAVTEVCGCGPIIPKRKDPRYNLKFQGG